MSARAGHVAAGAGAALADRVVLAVRTRWGKIVDFSADTGRILASEEKLQALGVAPAQAGWRWRPPH